MEVYQTEEQQVEAIKGFWKENGNTVISGIVIGFAGFIGFNLYKDSVLESELALADSYQALMESSTKNPQEFTANAEKFINENGTTSYASLTALALAKEAATHQDWAQAQKQLTIAIEKASNDGVKAIATIRLARVQVQLEEYAAALATLAKPLPESFTAAKEEIKGDTYLQQGKKDLARTAYQAAIAADGLATSPSLQMKLDDLAQAVNLPVVADTVKSGE
ncbi:YfgM family protein [Litorilituus lipolyticus]|uniref:Ancillary SecYEG translocon subunit n=1 Tax=Litorilituus lipolyticus TaxID=2491017 RepID=A0A502L8E6_9GAMM|nr:tetratricopeptide repeat protein [Litorilituus lipolyticus]TPH18621.1 tetratricopeptide repeat protein [Litorilituus lipolyticus]